MGTRGERQTDKLMRDRQADERQTKTEGEWEQEGTDRQTHRLMRQRQTKRGNGNNREGGKDRHRENSKTLFYKDCSLGSERGRDRGRQTERKRGLQ